MGGQMGTIPAFDDFPEIRALGSDAIQRLCDEWLRTPVARKHNVRRVAIGDEDLGCAIVDVGIDYLYDPLSEATEGQTVIFPLDDLLAFIIDHGVAEEDRSRLKQLVRLKRERSPFAYQRYRTHPAKRLYIKCKNPACQKVLETQYTILPNQRWDGTFEPFTCPACGQTHPLVAGDFFVMDASQVPAERPLKGLEEYLAKDSTIQQFSIVVPWSDRLLSQVMPLMGRLNDAEFEGRPAETVLFMGPEGGSPARFCRLYFLHRSHSFNKVYRPDNDTWEEVRHVATNKTLYEVADFGVLSSLKVSKLGS